MVDLKVGFTISAVVIMIMTVVVAPIFSEQIFAAKNSSTKSTSKTITKKHNWENYVMTNKRCKLADSVILVSGSASQPARCIITTEKLYS